KLVNCENREHCRQQRQHHHKRLNVTRPPKIVSGGKIKSCTDDNPQPFLSCHILDICLLITNESIDDEHGDTPTNRWPENFGSPVQPYPCSPQDRECHCQPLDDQEFRQPRGSHRERSKDNDCQNQSQDSVLAPSVNTFSIHKYRNPAESRKNL